MKNWLLKIWKNTGYIFFGDTGNLQGWRRETKMAWRSKTVRKTKKRMKSKLVLLVALAVLASFVLLFGVINTIRKYQADYSIEVLSQYRYSTNTLTARRGDIVDRNGTTVATSRPAYILILDARVLNAKFKNAQKEEKTYLEETLPAITQCFGISEEEIRKAVSENSTSSYIRFNGKTYVESEQVDAFKKMQETNKNLKGVWFETEFQRFYPFSESACHVIGFTTTDGGDGLWGLENYYNDYLTGTNGRVTSYLNEDYDLERNVYDAKNGNTVVTTIDMTAQSIIEADIKAYMDSVGAEHVGVILMDPNSGEIMSMATTGAYDLNNPWDLTKFYEQKEIDAMDETEKQEALNRIWRNFCISDSYEPGSVAKTLTIACGLEEDVFKPDDEYYCEGYKIVDGQRIRCHIREGHGELTVAEGLEESCNDVLMQLAWKIGVDKFADYQNKFNIGQLTGIDLPGEASCSSLHYNASNMGKLELSTNSFGQNFNTTMVQMAGAVSSLVNGGNYYQPYLVKKIVDESGTTVYEKNPVVLRSTVSPETSDAMRELMYGVVENGTGNIVNLEGYSIGGKTGAGEKQPRNGCYVISFISFTSVEDPRYLLYVVIDQPWIRDQSSSAEAQYLAREIWVDLLPYLNVFKDMNLTGWETDDPENPYKSDAYEIGVFDPLTPEESLEESKESAEAESLREQGLMKDEEGNIVPIVPESEQQETAPSEGEVAPENNPETAPSETQPETAPSAEPEQPAESQATPENGGDAQQPEAVPESQPAQEPAPAEE